MIEMDNMKSLYNEVSLFENKELPYDYGVNMAKKTIHNLFSKVTERDFNDKMENILNCEKGAGENTMRLDDVSGVKQVSVFDSEHGYYTLKWEITDKILKEVLQDFTIKNNCVYYELYYKGVDYETITDGFFDYHMNKQFCDPDGYSDHEKKVIAELYNETDEKKKMIFQVFKTQTPLKMMVEIIREE